jgi:hypothetical protein
VHSVGYFYCIYLGYIKLYGKYGNVKPRYVMFYRSPSNNSFPYFLFYGTIINIKIRCSILHVKIVTSCFAAYMLKQDSIASRFVTQPVTKHSAVFPFYCTLILFLDNQIPSPLSLSWQWQLLWNNKEICNQSEMKGGVLHPEYQVSHDTALIAFGN